MDARIIRSFIYLFGGLVVIFTLLILVNYIGSYTGAPSDLPGQEVSDKPDSAAAAAQQALAAARASGGGQPSSLPAFRKGLSTAAVNSNGAIMLVKEQDFGGVAEKPKDMLEMLSDMAGGPKKKPAPIALSDADLNKKVRQLGGVPDKEPRLKKGEMPEMGRGAGQEGVTLLTVPVDYKIFKSSDTWWAFSNSRKLKPAPHDFAAADLLILISLSDFPSGIFSVAGVEPGKKETVVKYRVNPLAMGAESPREQREGYASAPVPKGKPVRLQQVP